MNGVRAACFLPNPGRLRELLTPRAELLLNPCMMPQRNTAYDVFGVFQDGRLVPLDTRLTNMLVHEALEGKRIPEFVEYESIQPEFKYRHSRFDFKLADKSHRCLLEVKCCTLVEDRVAKFPDAPTQRGARHLLDLIRATKHGYRSAILFVIQNHNAKIFTPNWLTDTAFAETLIEASRTGVEVSARQVLFSRNSITLDGQVEVSLHPKTNRTKSTSVTKSGR